MVENESTLPPSPLPLPPLDPIAIAHFNAFWMRSFRSFLKEKERKKEREKEKELVSNPGPPKCDGQDGATDLSITPWLLLIFKKVKTFLEK